MAAYELGVPLDMVSVKPSDNMISPNASPTGGSIGSEMSCMVSAHVRHDGVVTRLLLALITAQSLC